MANPQDFLHADAVAYEDRGRRPVDAVFNVFVDEQGCCWAEDDATSEGGCGDFPPCWDSGDYDEQLLTGLDS